ncbi:cupin domain-containing protein [Variovorax dokdonensis]|uniref:Cupin domain-containing protein n=1 Tax=Variovorax dokdonensis TaxID=344883 RepID=A0ABT7NGW0_9BURK|nr:cupin domain-containing protein [Variovorax dokdonensis]MDM0047152.1 cupin domain-containing protein [Variovorax dokdonensis]
MAIAHAVSGDVVDLRAPSSPDRTVALFKAPDLEAMRLILAAGKTMPEHSVPGSLTVQCLKGRIELVLPDRSPVLEAGQFAYLGGGVPHALRALEDSDVLVTLVIVQAA